MSYCLNAQCYKPRNPDGTKFCQSCGLRLLLGDRYRPLKLLSQGGFGRTFLAIDECKPSKPYCAIKQFFPQNQSTDSSKKAAEMFRCEAIRLEELGHHPQIAELLAYFEQDRRQYLVQEYIEGQNLAAELAAKGAFNETQIRELLNDLLLVLRFVHEHNVIHRDIKPSNIIRRICDRQLVLVDFGAAKLTTDLALELTGTVIGSAGYTPPEQLLGKAVFASDLYSLGVTCIHLMTQTHPMNLFDVYEGTWVWRQYLKHPVSEELGQIFDKLLERATKQRYQSIEVVLNDLNFYPIETPISISTTPTVLANGCNSPAQTWKYIGTVFGHSTRVLSVAISPDGKTLASSSQNGTIKLWSLASGKAVPSMALSGGLGAVQSIGFSPNGKILVSCDRHGNIKFWQVENGELKSSFCGHLSPIQLIVISKDGQIIASAGDNKNIKIWRYSNQELIYTFNSQCHVNSIALTPDSKILASACQDGTIKLWSLKTGRLIQTLKWPAGAVYAVAFNPDGKSLAAGGHGSKIHLWNIENWELIDTLVSNLGSVRSLIFSPDGETLASGGEDSTIKFWHWKTGQLISSCPHHFQLVSSLAFSPDSRLLASGSHDKSIKLWQLSD